MEPVELNTKSLERKLHYTFKNKELLVRALTHRSFRFETGGKNTGQKDYENLEFLGDSVIELWVRHALFVMFDDFETGKLSKMSDFLVSTDSLSKLAKKIKLHKYILLGKGAEKEGGRENPSILCDVFEAIIGAIFLDSSFDEVSKVMEKLFLPAIKGMLDYKLPYDIRGAFDNMIQKKFSVRPEYIVDENKDFEKEDERFHACVVVKGTLLGVGEGRNKKEAIINASKDAYLNFTNDKK